MPLYVPDSLRHTRRATLDAQLHYILELRGTRTVHAMHLPIFSPSIDV
jgi:hypothetical protein